MKTIPKLISQNPYRILGVYANSTKKDIIANKGKATAFLKVNRPVEYPLDLKGILPPLERTLDSMNEADAHLAIAKEQIKYAPFWFLKITPLDDVAFNHLFAGNMTMAMDIWSKQETLSSIQNKLVCYLIDNEPESAIKVAEILYEKFGDIYISKVDTNSTLQMTGTELLHQFIDSLGEEIGMQELLDYKLSPDTKDYIGNKTIGPLISKISSEVEKTKKVDHKDPDARIEAARKLVVSTRDLLSQLKEVLSVNDPQYQMIADKLGLEILQCGIDYYNNSDDDDAAHTALKMQKYAQSVVVGSLAKQRCEENVKILQKIISELPPKEVMAEDRAIKAELSKFIRLPDKINYAVTLLNNTKPYLDRIKQKLGSSNAYYTYYLKISSQIVNNALHNVIEEVNAVQKDPDIALKLQLGLNLDYASLNRIKLVLREAWNATLLMDGFDMESDFKSRYAENRKILKSICENMGVSTYVSKSSTTTRPVSKPATSTSTTRSPSQSRASTAYDAKKPKEKTSSDTKGCWYCALFVILGIIGIVGLIWGISGYIVFLQILGGLSILLALGCVNSKEGTGCLAGIAIAVFAFLCFWGVDKLEKYKDDTEVESLLPNKDSKEESSSNTYYYGSESDDRSIEEGAEGADEDNQENIEDDTYDDYSYNEVNYNTGDKPYLSYYGKGKYDKSTKNSLTIRNDYGRDAVVFLESTSGKKIRHVYIKSGSTYTMDYIPAGSYEVKIMQGNSWNPDKNNGENAPKGGFMKEESMSKTGSNDILSYPASSSGQYGTYEITLYKVQNGNMYTQSIDESQMFN